MDSVKKYYDMVEDGELNQQDKQKKYKLSYEELESFAHLIKLNPHAATKALVDIVVNIKK